MLIAMTVQALFPDWAKLAGAIAPSIKVGQVNADQHKDLGGQYGIQGFPTIKFFGANKKKPTDYQGQRTAAAIAQHALKMLSDQVMTRGLLTRNIDVSRDGCITGGGEAGHKAFFLQRWQQVWRRRRWRKGSCNPSDRG